MYVLEKPDAMRLAANPGLLGAAAGPPSAAPVTLPNPAKTQVASTFPVTSHTSPAAASPVAPATTAAALPAPKSDLFGGLAKTLGLFGGGLDMAPTSSAAPASALAAAEAQKASFEALNFPAPAPAALPFSDVIADSKKLDRTLDPKGLFLGLS